MSSIAKMIATVVACNMCGQADGLKIRKDLNLCERTVTGFEATSVDKLDRTKRGAGGAITAVDNKAPQGANDVNNIIDMTRDL